MGATNEKLEVTNQGVRQANVLLASVNENSFGTNLRLDRVNEQLVDVAQSSTKPIARSAS
ncbi:MAG TPA: hypothetical protein VF614_03430 [Chthoniobacteraceae bacterium]